MKKMSPEERVRNATVQVLSETGRGSGAVYETESGTRYIVTNNHVIDHASSPSLIELDGEFYGQALFQGQTGYYRLVSRIDDGAIDLAILEIVSPLDEEFSNVHSILGAANDRLAFSPSAYSVEEVIQHISPTHGDYLMYSHSNGTRESVESKGHFRFQALEEDGSRSPSDTDLLKITSYVEGKDISNGSSGATIASTDGIPIAVISRRTDSTRDTGSPTGSGIPIAYAMEQIQAIEALKAQGHRPTITPETAFELSERRWSFDIAGEANPDEIILNAGMSRSPSERLAKHSPTTADYRGATASEIITEYRQADSNNEFLLSWMESQFTEFNYSLTPNRYDLFYDLVVSAREGGVFTEEDRDVALLSYITNNDPRHGAETPVEMIRQSAPYVTLSRASETSIKSELKPLMDEIDINSTSMMAPDKMNDAYQLSLEVAEVANSAADRGVTSPATIRELHDIEALGGVNIVRHDGTPIISR